MRYLPTNTPDALTTEVLEKKARLYADYMHVDEIREADDMVHTDDRAPSYFTPSGCQYLEVRREIENRKQTTYEQYSRSALVTEDLIQQAARSGNESMAEHLAERLERMEMQHPKYTEQRNAEAAEAYRKEPEEEEHRQYFYASA